MYVYIQSEPRLWTTGFYDPAGKWHGDQDFESPEEAANRAALLNSSVALIDPGKEASQTTEQIVSFLKTIIDLLSCIKSNTSN